ncbi:transposase [Thiothrix lacustris]|uniref:transposase n=2 Tax=Thiothrix lacustris TaxID=525917 RepID=UPI0027E540B2|nr:transposase [Thiothrix lacustris]WMP15787.1 transposase [Thiothrix lacustris]WMP15847.1 transposase [Thiothrix lacustris]WMP18186.1 transposase [Thiothrix lacustris]
MEEQHGLDHILYADEAGFSSTERYAWGWSKRGKTCEMPRPGGHGQKCNWISAILASDRSWQMPWVVNGTINRAVVEQWLAALGQTLPQNAADPKPYVLIWDNASFHLGGELLAIAKLYRIRIVQLPAYSPDFNPIEQCWATLKHYVRLALGKGRTLDEAIDEVFRA